MLSPSTSIQTSENAMSSKYVVIYNWQELSKLVIGVIFLLIKHRKFKFRQYVFWYFTKYLLFIILNHVSEFFASVNIRIWPLYFSLRTITIIGSFNCFCWYIKTLNDKAVRFARANFLSKHYDIEWFIFQCNETLE